MSKDKSEYLINRKDNQYEVVIGLEVLLTGWPI